MTKLQLTHPAGKKAVTMDSSKYEILKTAILTYLKNNGESTHKDMFGAIVMEFESKKIPFEGSIEWHMEWVKLDMEAKGLIKRKDGKSPVKLMLS